VPGRSIYAAPRWRLGVVRVAQDRTGAAALAGGAVTGAVLDQATCGFEPPLCWRRGAHGPFEERDRGATSARLRPRVRARGGCPTPPDGRGTPLLPLSPRRRGRRAPTLPRGAGATVARDGRVPRPGALARAGEIFDRSRRVALSQPQPQPTQLVGRAVVSTHRGVPRVVGRGDGYPKVVGADVA
jgi:hypothetical protein